MSCCAGDAVPITAAAVVVPVHDEQALLGPSLTAVDQAATAAGDVLEAVAVVVVLDSCRDASAAIAAAHVTRAATPTTIVAGAFGNVGLARRAGVDAALRALATRPSAAWIATTDADSRVPKTWLRDQLALAAEGAEAIAGVVSVEDWSEHAAHVPLRYRRRYDERPGHASRSVRDDHPHVHGANLGVRADAYLAVGGFPPLRSDEDVVLWRALGDAGYGRVSTRTISVITSARRRGRAPAGFARHLRLLAHTQFDP